MTFSTASGNNLHSMFSLQARLHAIQVDTGTYLNLSEADQELFSDWLKTFNMDETKGQISELLVSKAEVRSLYTKLVCGPNYDRHGCLNNIHEARYYQNYLFTCYSSSLCSL